MIYEATARSGQFGLNPDDPIYSTVYSEPTRPGRHQEIRRVETVLVSLKLDSVVNRVHGLVDGLLTTGVLRTGADLSLLARTLDVLKVKQTDRFKDILSLLDRANVPVGIQKLAQLRQEDIPGELDNPLVHAGNRRVLCVRLDLNNTIVDGLGRSGLVLGCTHLVHPLVLGQVTLGLELLVVVHVRQALPLASVIAELLVHTSDGQHRTQYRTSDGQHRTRHSEH